MSADQKNWLERLGDKIPGYSGYVSKERRRDVDKMHREHLADRLRAVKTPLNEAMREMTSTGRLMEVGPVDRVLKKLDRAENRLRFASYGYAGFFDVVKVEEAQLDALYAFDLALVERVEAVEEKARAVQSAAGREGGDVKAPASEVERAVDDLNDAFDKRHDAIDKFGQGGGDVAPGKPMFS